MLDLLLRTGYRCAYALMRVYWAVFRPATFGVLVAFWYGGEVLILRTSYARHLSLPGGYRRRRESSAAAAVRELREEIGLRVEPSELRPIFTMRHAWLGKDEHVDVLELHPAARPAVKIDRREIVAARFCPPAEALALDLNPPARRAIEERTSAAR
jgi:8-oxo-dGTP pyrophosphatase MutT (NUDIX family)